ncbi:UDP-glycosyltransferase UGT5-like [Vanessa cardui]|uniref:UDP-glycosyltransferase UGT5-like n=1 Tax=Vanessa cardui TaxID=171605 RepID=UPI001F1463B6|nr:UDP-glycosyltransferase UGT5-like [Vanessa cardui]
MLRLLLISVFVVFVTKYATAARILAVYPIPSISHQIAFRPLTNELVRRGHEVTVITTDPAYKPNEAPPNLTEIDVHDLSYAMWRDVVHSKSFGEFKDIQTQMTNVIRLVNDIFYSQIQMKEIQDIIKNKNGYYDLLLLEACAQPTLILSHLLKLPVIYITSMSPMEYHLKLIGAATHPLLYPSQFHQRSYNLSKWEKLHEMFKHMWLENELYQIQLDNDKVLKSMFGPDVPPLDDLFNNIHMVFLNVHPIWSDNRPVPPSVLYMGGIHKTPPRELPQDLQLYLDSSKNGVIYFSLGTNVSPSLLPPEKIQMFLNVLSQLPYDVLLKWDKDVLPGKSENIKIFKWLPQADILRHPNVKLFITQGGLQSTDESISAGVPLIGIPILGDQWYNVEKYVHHKIGIRLDLDSFSENEFRSSIEKIIGDNSYRDNIMRLRILMEDQPQTPLERAVWWTEHVLRHSGAKHLRAAGANISWAVYLELELLLTVVIVLFSVLLIMYLSIYVLRKLFRKKLASFVKIKTS